LKQIQHFVFGSNFGASLANENSAPIALPRTFLEISTGRVYNCRLNFVKVINLVVDRYHTMTIHFWLQLFSEGSFDVLVISEIFLEQNGVI
jgi:hypothetical protein